MQNETTRERKMKLNKKSKIEDTYAQNDGCNRKMKSKKKP